MKGLLGWVRSNLLIVIPLALAVVALPAGIYFSTGWNKKIRTQVDAEVKKATQSLNATVTYDIPTTVPGAQPISTRMVPNATANARAGELLKQAVGGSAEAREMLVAENALNKDRQMLIGGPGNAQRLFPEPASESDRVALLQRMAQTRPERYQSMLAESGAGAPPNPENVAARLTALRDEEVSRILSTRVEQKLTPEEEQQVRERLSIQRVERYQDEARNLSFYATPAVFDPPVTWNSTDLPSMETAWDWQHMFWIHADIIDAIERANTDDLTGVRRSVETAPVKRVERVHVDPMFPAESERGGSRGEEPPPTTAPVSEDLTQAIAADYSERHTGRVAWPKAPNGFFDLRMAEVDLIVDSASLPRVIHAINTTNFMTVVGMSIADHDAHADLQQGYYYGPADLVKVRLLVETIWLRSWVKQFMPPSVRERLGIAPDPAPAPAPEESA